MIGIIYLMTINIEAILKLLNEEEEKFINWVPLLIDTN
jgi:hypothetical protein